jgi:hypothetical protein
MAARARKFGLMMLVIGLAASGTISVAGGASAAPSTGATPSAPGLGKGKATHAHLSMVLDRVAQPAVATGSAKAQAAAAGTPQTGPGSLLRADSARLRVDIRVNGTDAATLSALSAAGAQVTFVSAANRTVTAAVKPVDLVKVGSVRGVQYVSQIYTPMVAGTSRASGRTSAAAPGALPAACTPIISEGDTMLKADMARSHYGIDGTGQTVGVLSDSFAQTTSPTSAAGDVTTGDLPGAANPCGHLTPVNVLDDTATGGEDEGRGMAQTVHDLAPGAHLAFATAFNSEGQFASNIHALATAGANVIVDDVSYFDEPMYQDGILSNAVSAVTAAGVAYYSSAANNNMVIGGHDVGSYEAVGGYRSTTCPAMSGVGAESLLDCHDFNPSSTITDRDYSFTINNNGSARIDLQWAQPLFGVTTDLDAFLVNAAGSILSFSEDDNIASGHPFEFVQWQNTTGSAQTVRLVIGRFAGSAKPRFKFVHMENGSTAITSVEYPTSIPPDVVGPTIFGHNGAAKAGSVAALPYTDPNTPEYYSSHGPVTLLFGPVNGTTPAAPLASPQVLAKPDFAATDCVKNTFFGSFDGSNWRFCGTSDAAPHAAAVAALVRQHRPTLTPAAVQSALKGTAGVVTNSIPAKTGAGRLDALNASDATVPTAVAVTSPTSLFQASRTMTVRYSSTDADSQIGSYDVRYRAAPWNGAFGAYTTRWSAVTATMESLTGSPGHEYCFSVRARDKAGNVTAFSPERCTVLAVDDRSLAATTSGWSRTTASAAYLGTITKTTIAGAKLQLTNAHTDHVALLVTTCSTCGRVTIYLNGIAWRTVSTVASSTHYQVILIQPAFSLRTTTIVLRSVDPGRQLLIDGLGIART